MKTIILFLLISFSLSAQDYYSPTKEMNTYKIQIVVGGLLSATSIHMMIKGMPDGRWDNINICWTLFALSGGLIVLENQYYMRKLTVSLTGMKLTF